MTAHTVTLRAPAKINLTLDVGRPRADGFHDLRTIMQALEMHDTVTVTRTPHASGVSFVVTGDEAAGIPADASNLVWQAAVRVQKIAAARFVASAGDLGIHIALTKHIPSQAGMGGGSSDAASALQALDKLWGLNLSMERLHTLGGELGSDVSFFLTGGTALCAGRGEQVTALPPLSPAWHLVVVKPACGVSTAAAYAALDALPHRVPGTSTERFVSGRSETVCANDFEPVVLALFPEVARVWHVLTAQGVRPHLCGSGSAIWCRAETDAQANELADFARLQQLGKAWTTRTAGIMPP